LTLLLPAEVRQLTVTESPNLTALEGTGDSALDRLEVSECRSLRTLQIRLRPASTVVASVCPNLTTLSLGGCAGLHDVTLDLDGGPLEVLLDSGEWHHLTTETHPFCFPSRVHFATHYRQLDSVSG